MKKVEFIFWLKTKIKQLKHVLTRSNNTTNCLTCHKDVNLQLSFYNFFQNPLICQKCFNSVKKINHSFYYKKQKITILFKYEGVLKELIIRWKFYQDQKAKKVIWMITKNKIPLFKQIIFPPSLLRKNNFYPFVSLFSKYRKHQVVFHKLKSYHQAKVSFKNRKSFIALKKPVPKNFVLIDDIYTSGTTIKKCIDLLGEKNTKYFETIIFATTQNLIKCDKITFRRNNLNGNIWFWKKKEE